MLEITVIGSSGKIGWSGNSENRGYSENRELRNFGDFRKIGEFRQSASDRGSAGAATKNFVRIGDRPAKPKIFAEIATLLAY